MTTSELIAARLKQLPQQQRAAFLLRRLDGMSNEHIALALNCSPEQVRRHVIDTIQAMMDDPEIARSMWSNQS